MSLLENFIEIRLHNVEDFLKIKETLTRIGIPSNKNNSLSQSCHILHKKGRYYLVHFKELFALDGKPSSMNEDDYVRRNTIALLLEEWNLFKIVNKKVITTESNISFVKIIPYKEKEDWQLVSKYNIGKKF